MSKYSNLPARVAVAVIAIPMIITVCYYGGLYFFLLVSIISVLALSEFYTLSEAKGGRPQKWTGIIGALLVNAAFFHEQLQNTIVPFFLDRGMTISILSKLQLFLTIFLLLLVLTLLIELFRNKGSAYLNAGYTLFGLAYVGLFLSTLIGIRELFGAEFPYWLLCEKVTMTGDYNAAAAHAITYPWGGLTVISILASIWICDTAAYFGGLSMGRHKLFPRVSPNKTWEGAVWGFAGAVLTMIAAQYYFLPYLEVHQAVIIGVIVGTLGQLGDLVESLLKRDAGVKDSSSLLPGHGGVFDRFDSLIFVSPILYLYIDFVVLS